MDIFVVPWTYDQQIASDANNCAKVIEILLEQLFSQQWPDKDTFGIQMAMEEAIMNAICHGNQRDESKFVRIEMRIDNNHFFGCVTDEGEGFQIDDVPDPTAIENIQKTSGRGVRLIQHFMDSAEYNAKGNSIVVRKQRSQNI